MVINISIYLLIFLFACLFIFLCIIYNIYLYGFVLCVFNAPNCRAFLLSLRALKCFFRTGVIIRARSLDLQQKHSCRERVSFQSWVGVGHVALGAALPRNHPMFRSNCGPAVSTSKKRTSGTQRQNLEGCTKTQTCPCCLRPPKSCVY